MLRCWQSRHRHHAASAARACDCVRTDQHPTPSFLTPSATQMGTKLTTNQHDSPKGSLVWVRRGSTCALYNYVALGSCTVLGTIAILRSCISLEMYTTVFCGKSTAAYWLQHKNDNTSKHLISEFGQYTALEKSHWPETEKKSVATPGRSVFGAALEQASRER